jgi:hypothetical protein
MSPSQSCSAPDERPTVRRRSIDGPEETTWPFHIRLRATRALASPSGQKPNTRAREGLRLPAAAPHDEIYDALVRHSPKDARKAVEHHLSRIRNRVGAFGRLARQWRPSSLLNDRGSAGLAY